MGILTPINGLFFYIAETCFKIVKSFLEVWDMTVIGNPLVFSYKVLFVRQEKKNLQVSFNSCCFWFCWLWCPPSLFLVAISRTVTLAQRAAQSALEPSKEFAGSEHNKNCAASRDSWRLSAGFGSSRWPSAAWGLGNSVQPVPRAASHYDGSKTVLQICQPNRTDSLHVLVFKRDL